MEALKASAKDKPAVSEETGARPVKTDYEMTQEQLAEIYFSAAEKKPQSPPPMIIKVIERPGIASVIPWIITSIAFLITAFSLFSTKRVFVDIKVIDEKSGYFASAEPPAAVVEPEAPVDPGATEVSMRGAMLEGAGRLKSEFSNEGLMLVNTSVAPFARASVQMAPTDLSDRKIVFYARGVRGGEKLGFSLKDKNNNSAFERGKVYPFPDGLSTEWRRAEIPLEGTAKEFNPRKVISMRFEFGSNVDNKAGDTVYVKDLRIV